MKTTKKRKIADLTYEKRTMPVSLIDAGTPREDFEVKELKMRASYILLNGAPEFSVNDAGNGRYTLLVGDRDFHAACLSGMKEVTARVYSFTEKHAEVFSLVEKLKTERMGAMEEAYLMRRLIDDCHFTQDDIAGLIGKSRPAVANTLRLLTLVPEVVGLLEIGRLSAGHARTLVKVPKEKQYAFAQEAIKRKYSVREMERAVKAFLTPPEVLKLEAQAKAAARSEELKSFVERMRAVFRTKVSLIGNEKKGRIYIDYYSPEDLFRIEQYLDLIETCSEEE